jgi:hypothetical protein
MQYIQSLIYFMRNNFVDKKRSHIPIFTLDILSNQDFKIPTRKKVRNVPDEGNGKKGEVPIIRPTEMTVILQNTSQIEKCKRPDQVKKRVNHRENDHHHQRFSIEKVETLQHIQGSKEHEARQIPVSVQIPPVVIQEN